MESKTNEYIPPTFEIHNTNVTINFSGLSLNLGSYPTAGLHGISSGGLGAPINLLGISGLNNALINPFIRAEVFEKNITINILNKKKEDNKSKVNKKESKLQKGKLLWSDEFDYLGEPNPNEWNLEDDHGWKTDEQQIYSKNNAQVNDGKLTIISRKESFNNKEEYTSARLISKRSFKYGIIEYRAKLPRGNDTWPAFWLLSAKRPLLWPHDGEIVIMGHEGKEPGYSHATFHTTKYNQFKGVQKGNKVKVDNIFDEFHTYSVDWNPNRLKFYIDDEEIFSYYKELNAQEDSWPFDNEMNIIINTAIGNQHGDKQDIDDSIFPVYHVIDYVRQYKLKE